MTRRQESEPITIGDFSGGEADLPFTKMPAKFSVAMVNFYPTQTGGVAFTPGYARVNTATVTEALSSGHAFIKADGTKIVLTAGEGKVYKVVANALSAIKAGLDSAATARFITANDKCIIMNGVDAPMKYDGTSVTALGGSPPATAFKGVFHRSRVWMIERTNKLLASYSALNAIEDYTTAHDAGYLDFTKVLKSGDELTDIESYKDLLIFYFKNHVLIYSGSNPTDYGDFQIVDSIEGAGAITGTVKACGLDHFFLSQIGARSLKQLTATGPAPEQMISKNIATRLMRSMTGNPSGPFASAHFQRLSWYMLLINDEVWTYSYSLGAWFRMSGMPNINGMFSDSDGSSVYFTGNGFLYQFDSGWTFDGQAIPRVWDHAWMKFFRNSENASPKVITLDTSAALSVSFQMMQRFDLNAGNSDVVQDFDTVPLPSLMDDTVLDVWDNAFLMDTEGYESLRLPLFGRGTTMQMSFMSTDTNGPCEINSMKILFVPGGD